MRCGLSGGPGRLREALGSSHRSTASGYPKHAILQTRTVHVNCSSLNRHSRRLSSVSDKFQSKTGSGFLKRLLRESEPRSDFDLAGEI